MCGVDKPISNDAIGQFIEAMQAVGLEPPEDIEPGKFHRFPGVGKRLSNRAGWCILFEDGQGGCFGDFSSGLDETWQAKRDKPYSREERAKFARQVNAAKEQAEAKRQQQHANAAGKAASIWNEATPANNDHPYLDRKRIQPHGARIHKGALVLPVMDFTGRLTSLQFIANDGGKRLLSGGRKRGCFIPVSGEGENPFRVIICEGWATGCTLAEDEPTTLVLSAIDAGNLGPVAVAARRRWPSAELIIAGDDDRLTACNPGASKARTAAIAANASLALPQWPDNAPEHLTDFNDLAGWLAGGGA